MSSNGAIPHHPARRNSLKVCSMGSAGAPTPPQARRYGVAQSPRLQVLIVSASSRHGDNARASKRLSCQLLGCSSPFTLNRLGVLSPVAHRARLAAYQEVMSDIDRKRDESTETLVIPAQYRKAKKLSWAGRFYDVLDIEDREERWLLYKLDAVLVTFMSAGYFLKYLCVRQSLRSRLRGAVHGTTGPSDPASEVVVLRLTRCRR